MLSPNVASQFFPLLSPVNKGGEDTKRDVHTCSCTPSQAAMCSYYIYKQKKIYSSKTQVVLALYIS